MQSEMQTITVRAVKSMESNLEVSSSLTGLAFIGMFSELADRGYTLPVKDVDGPDWDVLAQRGLLIHKDQMTSKRWVAGSLALGVVSSACTLNSTIDEHCLDFNA